MTGEPFRATCVMIGTRPLFRRAELQSLLEVIEGERLFAPTHWSLSERSREPYSREAIWNRLFTQQQEGPFAQTQLYLRRSKAIKYDASLSLYERPHVDFELDPKLTIGQREQMFGFCDRLAESFQPDIGIAHVWYRNAPEREDDTWENDDERDGELLFSTALMPPVEYFDIGPTGLGMRTYVGPHYVAQLGRDRIESLPGVVAKLDWGGYRIDLVPEPWKADLPTLVVAWRAAMAHLAPAKVFAEPIIRDRRLRGYTKGERVIIGGEVNG